MFISASRRTDIPTFYSEWFFNRLRDGFVLARNPVSKHQISRIVLSPDVVDGIVFWTKNPAPMLEKLDLLQNYMYYFQFTLNAYGRDVETGIPSKDKVIVPAFQRLSDIIGPDRVIWRYDPIFLNETYTVEYHVRYFEALAKRLAPYTRKCTISFLDVYPSNAKRLSALSIQKLTPEVEKTLAKRLAEIAQSYSLRMDTCAEEIDLQQYGIQHARCIDDRLFETLLKCPLNVRMDKNQRLACGCVESIDIGVYHTCRNGCRYCYAGIDERSAQTNMGMHCPQAPLLSGEVGPGDKITQRHMHTHRSNQLELSCWTKGPNTC